MSPYRMLSVDNEISNIYIYLLTETAEVQHVLPSEVSETLKSLGAPAMFSLQQSFNRAKKRLVFALLLKGQTMRHQN